MLDKQDHKGGRGDAAPKQSEADSQKRKRDANIDKGKEGKAGAKQPEIAANTQKKFELAKMTGLANLSKIVEGQEPVTKSLIPQHIEQGVLIPLKTTLELRDDHQCGQALITRSPVRSTSAVISLLRDLLPEEIVKGMPHLRRCAKPIDLPAHLKTQFMNDTAMSKQIHTGKSNWVYVLLGLEATLSRKEMAEALAKLEGFEDGVFIASIPVPLLAPTSQIQAALWTSQFWPTMYRKNNPLGPHPSLVIRATDEIADDSPIWMALAHDMAVKAKESGYGEAVGACIVYRGEGGPQLVAVAGDARWYRQPKSSKTGNPMAHAVLRAVSMVAQKLVRAEKRGQRKRSVASSRKEPPRPPPTQTSGATSAAAAAAAAAATATAAGDQAKDQARDQGRDQAGNQARDKAKPSGSAQDAVVCQVHNAVQDRVRDRLSRNRDRGNTGRRQRLAFEVFQDKPLLEEEDRIFAEEHPTPDGYLCHGLELYVTHEPCAMCSMAILHSRMGKVVFANRMPLTGGLSAEDRVLAPTAAVDGPSSNKAQDRDIPSGEGIHGLGLFWRRELNWSLLAWEWEAHCCCKPLDMDPTTHA